MSPCLPICKEGTIFVEIPCDAKERVYQDKNNKCYGCVCKATVNGKPKLTRDDCKVENSEPISDKACECDCKPGTVRYDNPYKSSVFGIQEAFRCITRCKGYEQYSWDHRKCIANRCYDKINDGVVPLPDCYDGKELTDGCVCACPPGTLWSGSYCECLPGKQRVFRKPGGTMPDKNPVYGYDYVCVRCKTNEVYNWDLKRCVVIASGPSNSSLYNIDNLGYNLIESL